MGSRIIPVPSFTIVVFGATGDLAQRKIYPALWQRLLAGQAPDDFRLVGVARESLSASSFRELVRASLPQTEDKTTAARLQKWLANANYFSLNASADASAEGWREFAAAMQPLPAPQVFYCAVAPNIAGDLCKRLQESGVLSETSRIVLEKPIGWDVASARALNQTAQATAAEKQIYRIDHYLGKETVQNLMALRFANALFEPLWNARMIDHIQITVAESIGVGARGGYYERAGATRDMVQNHLLQLLCLMAMEAPKKYDANSIRDEKLKVLQSLCPIPIESESAAAHVALGQYDDYASDIGSKAAKAETFVAIKCAIDNWRWAGMPFYLRTGKRLAARRSEIIAHFKSPPHSIFPAIENLAGNQLAVCLQPQEGITLHLNIKEPGLGGFRLSESTLDMSFSDSLDAPLPDAYERLLMDVVRGDQTLFMRNDEVEAAWQWVEPIINYAAQTAPQVYASNSSGPDAAALLMQNDGRQWRAIGD